MTLALACLTPEFVTLVADRRLSRGGDPENDLLTKVVVVCDRGAVGYSGLAEFPNGRKMDEWIVQILSKAKVTSLSDAARVLQTEANGAFKHLPYLEAQRRHAFVLVGWSVPAANVRQPVVCTVSNALNDDWNWLPSAENEFQRRTFVQEDPKKFTVFSVGARVPVSVGNYIRRSLRAGFPKGIGPGSVVRICARGIREVAARDSSVGHDLLAVCVPPCSLTPGPRLVLAGGPTPNAVTFLDLRMPLEFGTWSGPHFVCGGAGFTDVKVGSLEPTSAA